METKPSVLSGAAWWRDRLFVWAMFPVCFLLVGGYVAWRALTCLVDSWGDLRAGRVPAAFRLAAGPVRHSGRVGGRLRR